MLAMATPLTPSANANIGMAVTVTRRRCTDVLQSFAIRAERGQLPSKMWPSGYAWYPLALYPHIPVRAHITSILLVTSHGFAHVSTINWPGWSGPLGGELSTIEAIARYVQALGG